MTIATFKTELTPAVVEIPAGRSVILTIDGQPVVFLRADEVRTRTTFLKQEYKQYDYCGMGITIKDPDGFDYKYVSGCATTMSLEVLNNSVESVTAAYAQRYAVMWE
jgi:hypothetical protein